MTTAEYRMKDKIGCLVRLKRDLTTVGGVTFHAGAIMKIESCWRGTWSLAAEKPFAIATPGPSRIRQVHRGYVEFI